MESLINKYKRYNLQFWCWWFTDILTVVLVFAEILSEDVSIFVILCESALAVLSIIFFIIYGVKRTKVLNEMIMILSRELNDAEAITEYLTQKGISKRIVRAYARSFFATQRKKEYKEIPTELKTNYTCPVCGSTNIAKAKSSLDEFFWVIVILSALGNTISTFTIIVFGICWVVSIITSIINKLSGNNAKEMVCKSCKAKFKI